MPFKFNPFSGNFDQTGSGGGGSSYLDGEVQNFSALPQTIGSPAVDSAYLVREAEGAWLLNRKPAGIYIRTANTGVRASDWTYAGEFPDVFNDANLVVYNNTDSTKNVKFDASAIATGTTRTISVPDKNITLDDAGDSRTPSAHAASHASSGSDPLAPSDIGAQSIFVTDSLVLSTGAEVTLTAARAKILDVLNFSGSDVDVVLPQTGNQVGDTFVFRWASGSNQILVRGVSAGSPVISLTSGEQKRVIRGTSNWSVIPVDTHTHNASAITSGTLDIARIPTGTGSTQVALGDHTHELTALAATGAANGTVLTANGSGGVTFAAASGGGVTGAAASASDVLGVSGANITGVDAGSADRLVFWDDSANKLTYLEAGSGLSISGTTLTATGGGSGGTKTYAVFTAEHNQPPATAFATLDTRNSIAVLDFDDATTESAVFVGIMPEAASLGSGLIVRIHFMATTATSGNVRWSVSFERGNTDLDADSFDTATAATTATSSTSGIPAVSAITCTTIDGITAGDPFRLRVQRLGADAADSMSGDAEILAVEIRSAA